MAERKSIVQQTNQQGKRLLMWIGIVGVLVISIGVIAFTFTQSSLSDAEAIDIARMPAEITVDEAYQKYEEGAFLLDVRTREEWAEFHIPSTTLIPLDELESRVDELPTGKEIVVVCRSGNRSQVGRDILLEAGFEQATSMAGGVKAWGAAGYPLE